MNILSKKYYLLFLITGLLFSSCQQKTSNSFTNIRGKIVNPKSDFVIISRDFLTLTSDTLSLVAENKVKGKVKTPEEGLYFIQILPEFQTIYLKPGGSLDFHINVDEFDESLSFSGSLGFENNLLIELYLENEKESQYFFQTDFDFTPDVFEHKLDSFANLKKQLIANYQDEYKKTTKKYKEIVDLLDKSIQYSLKETYIKKHPDQTFPSGFMSFEKILKEDLPDPNVIYMYAFTENYLEKRVPKNQSKPNTFYEIAKIIDQEITDENFKDNLLAKYCNRYIKQNLIAKPDSVVHFYTKKLHNRIYKSHCLHLILKNGRIQNGKQFPDVEVQNLNLEKTSINDYLSNQKTLIASWDLNKRKNFISNLNKLRKIHQELPEIQIIILNLNPKSQEEWVIEAPKNSPFTYLQLTNARDLFLIKPYHLSQVYLVNNDTIERSLINMYTPNFNKYLEIFLSENK